MSFWFFFIFFILLYLNGQNQNQMMPYLLPNRILFSRSRLREKKLLGKSASIAAEYGKSLFFPFVGRPDVRLFVTMTKGIRAAFLIENLNGSGHVKHDDQSYAKLTSLIHLENGD